MMLKSHDMTCDVAIDGREAYMSVRKNDYDIVFMDCQMPVMDGYESTSKIREDEGDKKHTTIIAMTANVMEGDRAKCIEAGMDDYISKPIDFNKMFKFIEENSKHQEKSLEYFWFIDESINRFVNETGLEREDAKELFEVYMNCLPDLMTEIKDAINKSDFEQVGKLTYKLKGTSGNLRITLINELAVKLEEAALEQGKDDCDEFFEELEELLQ